jgi:hypothetical protein
MPLEITLSFLSPITPTSTLRQSIPASYVTVYVKGNVNVNVYMDLNGQWASGQRGSRITWQFDNIISEDGRNPLKKWEVRKETEQLLSEFRDRSEWGSVYFIGPSVSRRCRCLDRP